jgi:hypothetical protein
MPSSEGAWQPSARSARYALFSSMFRHAFSKDILTETANAQWSKAMVGGEEQALSRQVEEAETQIDSRSSDLALLRMTLPKFSHADCRILGCQAHPLQQPSPGVSVGTAAPSFLPFASSLVRSAES